MREQKMSDWLIILLIVGFLVGWFVLQKWVLPKFGIST